MVWYHVIVPYKESDAVTPVEPQDEPALAEVLDAFADLTAAQRRLRGRDAPARAGLSFAQLRVLTALEEDGCPAGRLAERAGVTPATVTGMLDILEEQGVVTRERSASDRRVVIARLTPEGRRLRDRRRAEVRGVVRGRARDPRPGRPRRGAPGAAAPGRRAGGPVTAEEAMDRRRLWAVLGSLMLVMLLAALDQTIVATALPTIVGDLGGLEHLSWVVTAYLLAQTVVTPLYGKLGDLFGRKRVLQAAIVVFLIGSVLCGLARTMPELIAFRAVQGLGGGGLMVGAQAALGDVVPPRERGRYTGLFIAIFGAASVAGPLLGGFITSHLSWEWIFYINLPLGFLAFAVLAATFPTVRSDARPALDVAGSALLAVGLTAVVLVTTLGGTTFAWSSPAIVGLAVLGVVALVAFFLVERRAAEPILPPRLWRSATFRITSAVGLIIGFALFGAVTFLPLFQQVVRGESPTASGLQLLPLMGGVMVSSVLSGRMIAVHRPLPRSTPSSARR